MAAFQGVATSASQSLAVSTVETVLQLVAATNHRVKLLQWGIFFDGVSVTAEPVLVEIVRQSTAGTSGVNTPVKVDDSLAETLLTTARDGFSSTEPTSTDVLWAGKVHPQTGYAEILPLGQEIIIGGGDRLGIRCTAAAIVTATAIMKFEE